MFKSNPEIKIILGFAGSLLTGAAAFVVLAYLQSGRRGHASPLVPRPIEQELTRLVTKLDARFGREWVDRGLDALQSALRGTGPDNLVKLLLPVSQALWEHQKKRSSLFDLSRFALLLGRK
jgi:hypothetical protein